MTITINNNRGEKPDLEVVKKNVVRGILKNHSSENVMKEILGNCNLQNAEVRWDKSTQLIKSNKFEGDKEEK